MRSEDQVSQATAEAVLVALRVSKPNASLPTADEIRSRLPQLLAPAAADPPPSVSRDIEMLTIPQVLAALKISRPTAWRMVRDGRLVVTRIGRRVLVSHADLERLVRRCRSTKPARKET